MAVNRARGMRDLLPEDMIPRLRVLDTVRAVFRRHGFDPLETPALERIETLTGKYGDEGSQLIFKVLKRGEAGERGEVGLVQRPQALHGGGGPPLLGQVLERAHFALLQGGDDGVGLFAQEFDVQHREGT